MKWKGNEDDRVNIVSRYLEGGIEGISTGVHEDTISAAEGIAQRNDSADQGQGRGSSIDGASTGGRQGNADRTSLLPSNQASHWYGMMTEPRQRIHYISVKRDTFVSLLGKHGWDLSGSYMRKPLRGKEVIGETVDCDGELLTVKVAFRADLEVTSTMRPWAVCERPIRPEAIDPAVTVGEQYDRKVRAAAVNTDGREMPADELTPMEAAILEFHGFR